MMNNRNIPEKEIEKILKKSVLQEPSNDLEDRIMRKIHANAKNAHSYNFGKWITLMVYSIIGVIFTYFLFMPKSGKSTSNLNESFNLIRFQVVDPELFNLSPSQPYLIMSIIVFAVAVWMIILFNLPKKDTIRKYH
jgi:hypothetical protein